MFAGQTVKTLGNVLGVVKSIREDGVVIVEPSNWLLANNKPPVFYMNAKDVCGLYSVDDVISCSFGKGQIKEIRSDGVFVVTLANWALADGKSPILYLQESSISKYVPPVEKALPGPSYVEQCLKRAFDFKNEATAFYKESKFDQARSKYLEALGSLHYLNADLSNEEKASIFELTVPCHNNIALCCMNLEKYGECIAFAKNCLLVIVSLEEKIAQGSQVWKCLCELKGVTMEKLIEWKRKALFYMGKAELKNKDFEDAVTHLEASVALMPATASTIADVAKIKELIETAKKYRAAELKKEKSTWSKAFKHSKAEQEAEEAAAVATAAATASAARSPVKPAGGAATQDKAAGSKKGAAVPLGIDVNNLFKKDKDAKSNAVARHDNSFTTWLFGLGFFGLFGAGLFLFQRSRLFRK